ncbi:MAG TPA: ribulose bisphosphate carboxylase small subunit [Myxococcota bacterium]|nr:ribulose bisphosphate carboxylase small subunit [Myxococcota bacterium]
MSVTRSEAPRPARARRLGTFSYLPEMNAARVRRQIEYILGRGWIPAIEHVETDRATDHYWYLWKLPLFGERSVDRVMAEITACRRGFPGHYVRLVGYDNGRQTQGARIVVYHGDRRAN